MVDAGDLLRDPGAILSQLSDDYSKGMLTWKPGIAEDRTENPYFEE